MAHAAPQDAHQCKSAMLWHKELSDDSDDSSASHHQDDKRLIRRVCSPARPRAWISSYYKTNFGVKRYRPHFPGDDHSSHKPWFGQQGRFHWKYNFHPKPQHVSLRERERGQEEEKWHERRESTDGRSPPKHNKAPRTFLQRSTSRRDKDKQFTVGRSGGSHSGERAHRRTRSGDRDRGRDAELPSSVGRAAERDAAIQQKRREIDEVYAQECEIVGLVAKMLVAKDPSLEFPIQSSLRENLRDIGKRCLEAMEKYIEDYDSREPSHYPDTHPSGLSR